MFTLNINYVEDDIKTLSWMKNPNDLLSDLNVNMIHYHDSYELNIQNYQSNICFKMRSFRKNNIASNSPTWDDKNLKKIV